MRENLSAGGGGVTGWGIEAGSSVLQLVVSHVCGS